MKKLCALFITACIAVNCFAYEFTYTLPRKGRSDKWLTAGLRGTFNNTWLLNKNQQNDDRMKFVPSWGYAGGIMSAAMDGERVADGCVKYLEGN